MRASLTLAGLAIVAATVSLALVTFTRCTNPLGLVGWGSAGLDAAAAALVALAWVEHLRHYRGHGPSNLMLVAANALALLGLSIIAGVVVLAQFFPVHCLIV